MHLSSWPVPVAVLVSAVAVAAPSHADDTMEKCVSAYEQAQRLRKADDLLGAKAQLEACLFPRCPRQLRRDCDHWAREVEAETPSFVVEWNDPTRSVTLWLDGTRVDSAAGTPMVVNPGPHVIEASVDGGDKLAYRVTARRGDQQRRVHVAIPPKIPQHVWAFAGLGVAELGAAGYFVLRGHNEDEAEAVRVSNVAAGVSLGMALVSFGAAGWFYLKRPAPYWTESGETEPSLGIRLRGSNVELVGQF